MRYHRNQPVRSNNLHQHHCDNLKGVFLIGTFILIYILLFLRSLVFVANCYGCLCCFVSNVSNLSETHLRCRKCFDRMNEHLHTCSPGQALIGHFQMLSTLIHPLLPLWTLLRGSCRDIPCLSGRLSQRRFADRPNTSYERGRSPPPAILPIYLSTECDLHHGCRATKSFFWRSRSKQLGFEHHRSGATNGIDYSSSWRRHSRRCRRSDGSRSTRTSRRSSCGGNGNDAALSIPAFVPHCPHRSDILCYSGNGSSRTFIQNQSVVFRPNSTRRTTYEAFTNILELGTDLRLVAAISSAARAVFTLDMRNFKNAIIVFIFTQKYGDLISCPCIRTLLIICEERLVRSRQSA